MLHLQLSSAGYASVNDVPALTQILLNHVVSGAVKSTDLTTTYIKTLAKGTASTTTFEYVCKHWRKGNA
jgi:uncharacterized surface protein with fasciclin (FAS1) repeats